MIGPLGSWYMHTETSTLFALTGYMKIDDEVYLIGKANSGKIVCASMSECSKVEEVGMEIQIVRSDEELYDILDDTLNADLRETAHPGLTYEEGVRAGIEWLIDSRAPHPLGDV
jgi:hypothetical protein